MLNKPITIKSTFQTKMQHKYFPTKFLMEICKKQFYQIFTFRAVWRARCNLIISPGSRKKISSDVGKSFVYPFSIILIYYSY